MPHHLPRIITPNNRLRGPIKKEPSMSNIFTLQRVIIALVLLYAPAQSSASTIALETRHDGTRPIDNEELTVSYIVSP
jgi:hypothetical protein